MCGVAAAVASSVSAAPEWSGAFTIAPVSAPSLVLEAAGSGDAAGAVVSIADPTGKPNQQWVLVADPDGSYAIQAGANPALVLSAAAGGAENGTLIVLEADARKPWQRWEVKRNRDNGTVSLIPRHAPGKGLDDFGGGNKPGSRQDLWTYDPWDEHLQWTLKPLAGAAYPADLPKPGVIHELTFADSAIYPGTSRRVTVFVPAEYDGSKPACVYVRQDGYNPSEKGMIEALIAAKDMPVTIGVFIPPGELPAPMPGTLGRRNRCFEYDAVGDAYVRFVTEEVLPFVSRKLGLKLSSSGNDRCIAGCSSGGICAFNAAWERPDAFSRVYANSGSFVAFRGGHEFPTLIRKVEAKPIRAYLTTGMHDMENCAGDWYLLDQEMDKALKFSGYDYSFRAIDGPHGAGWNQYFCEAMRFIWKGWPEPARAGESAPRVRDIILPGQAWEPVAGDFAGARSPVCNSKGEVLFVDASGLTIRRIGVDGAVSAFAKASGRIDGLAVGAKDEVYAVSATTGKVLRFDASGHASTVAEGVRGRYAVARPDGSLYVAGPGAKARDGDCVWLVKGGHATGVGTGPKRATGLAIRPDQWLLAAADGDSKWVHSYRIQDDGTLADHERFYWLHVADWDDDAGAESVCYSREGRMLTATRMGVQVSADDGPTQVILPLPSRARVTGLCLGGATFDTLYAFDAAGKLWRRAVRVHAAGAFTPWTAAPGTPL